MATVTKRIGIKWIETGCFLTTSDVVTAMQRPGRGLVLLKTPLARPLITGAYP